VGDRTTGGHDGLRSPVEHGHRDVAGGAARAAVFGISDGLVSNVGLILGVAGADSAADLVRVAGLAGLLAGAISMAAGEYNSMRVQQELFERELSLERREIERNPSVEAVELAQRYQSRGVDAGLAQELAASLMEDPELALEFHAREELGVNPGNLGSPVGAALASLAAFTVGALVPLLPWFVLDGTSALIVTLVLAMVAALSIGFAISRFTEGPPGRAMARQLVFTAVPAALTFAIGSAIGANLEGG
jgi:VIT1/CCC1 family predicted Fe2+/Mn2+ transporter